MTTHPITINATVHIHVGDAGALQTIIEQNRSIIMSLADLAAAVAENTQVDQSSITLIEGLADKLDALGIDNAELDQLTAELRTSSASLASKVAENTPAAPTDPTEPAPVDTPADGTPVDGTADTPVDGTTPTDEEIAANVDQAIESDAPQG